MARGIGRPMAVLVLSDEERSYLERQARRRRVARSLSRSLPHDPALAQTASRNKAVAIELGVHEHTVGKWRRRFLKERIEGLSDEPRPGRPRTLTDEKVAAVHRADAGDDAGRRDPTGRSVSMARESGLSHTTVRRIWAAFSVQPHRSETFKLSSDPLFVDKVRDIIGLYLSPPDRALVLCVDEKKPDPGTRSHTAGSADAAGQCLSAAHTTTSVTAPPRCFAALDVATGFVIGKCYRRHRAREFPRLPEGDRQACPGGAGRPHRHGQLRHPQDRSGQGLAGAASALARPLHADLGVLDQPGRTLVR